MKDIQIGDDVTIAGKVISVRKNHFIDTIEILVQTNHAHVHWFDVSEIQTHRPNRKKNSHGKKEKG